MGKEALIAGKEHAGKGKFPDDSTKHISL